MASANEEEDERKRQRDFSARYTSWWWSTNQIARSKINDTAMFSSINRRNRVEKIDKDDLKNALLSLFALRDSVCPNKEKAGIVRLLRTEGSQFDHILAGILEAGKVSRLDIRLYQHFYRIGESMQSRVKKIDDPMNDVKKNLDSIDMNSSVPTPSDQEKITDEYSTFSDDLKQKVIEKFPKYNLLIKALVNSGLSLNAIVDIMKILKSNEA